MMVTTGTSKIVAVCVFRYSAIIICFGAATCASAPATHKYVQKISNGTHSFAAVSVYQSAAHRVCTGTTPDVVVNVFQKYAKTF